MVHVWRVAIALVVCAFVGVFPGATAYAWFNDVTDDYPASQDVPVSGSALTGADVPEGVYNITATTSSYMCKLSSVTLTSVGGELWATFTMSGAYNALYLGTTEDAAASTNEDGTDVSAYYISDPLEGYVTRQFSLPIPALNEEITLATYSGGSKGIDKGMWYTRTVVFNSSSEVDDAIAGGDDGQDESGGDDTPSDDPGGSDDDSGYIPDESGDEGSQEDEASGDVVPDNGTDDDPADDGSADDPGDDDSESKSKSSSSAAPKGSSGTPSNSAENNQNNSGDDANGEEGNSSEEEKSSKAAASSEAAAPKDEKAKAGPRMKEISFAGNQVVELGEGVDPELLKKQENEQNKVQQAGIVAASVLGAVNAALIGAYVIGLRRTKPQLFVKAAKNFSRLRGKN